MKTNFLFFAAIIIALSTIIFSCNKAEVIAEQETLQPNRVLKAKEKHIYYAAWDEWGRTSRDCAGNGLCNFRDCWFCCTENDVIVDCDSRQSRAGEYATIMIDADTKKGDFIIELNPNIVEQEAAISNQSIFYIDEDLETDDFILHQGQYPFDSQIGTYGGYRLDITQK
jgi:hypothetical protein